MHAGTSSASSGGNPGGWWNERTQHEDSDRLSSTQPRQQVLRPEAAAQVGDAGAEQVLGERAVGVGIHRLQRGGLCCAPHNQLRQAQNCRSRHVRLLRTAASRRGRVARPSRGAESQQAARPGAVRLAIASQR